MAAIDCVLISPYFVEISLRLSATKPRSARRSSRSSNRSPRSSASLKAISSMPSCVSLTSSMRARRLGPTSLTVARTGWPALPYKSQNTTGLASLA